MELNNHDQLQVMDWRKEEQPLQTIFDATVRHLAAQKRPAWNERGIYLLKENFQGSEVLRVVKGPCTIPQLPVTLTRIFKPGKYKVE